MTAGKYFGYIIIITKIKQNNLRRQTEQKRCTYIHDRAEKKPKSNERKKSIEHSSKCTNEQTLRINLYKTPRYLLAFFVATKLSDFEGQHGGKHFQPFSKCCEMEVIVQNVQSNIIFPQGFYSRPGDYWLAEDTVA